MRLLYITPFHFLPPFWGGAVRTYQTILKLAEEHDVSVVFPSFQQFPRHDGRDYAEWLEANGVELRCVGPAKSYLQYINPLLLKASSSLMREKSIEFIICDYMWAGGYARLLSSMYPVPYILLQHNVEYLIARQIAYERPVFTYLFEKLAISGADHVFCVSERDRNAMTCLYGVPEEGITVSPNGFDARIFSPDISCERVRRKYGRAGPLFLFNAKMDYLPNRNGLLSLFRHVIPAVLSENKDAHFLIIGGGNGFRCPDLFPENVTYLGPVRDLAPYVRAADAVLVPLMAGGGTRIKILEAIACGTPVISTVFGAEGLDKRLVGSHVHLADTWDDFSSLCLQVSELPRKGPSMRFVSVYSWCSALEPISEFFRERESINLSPSRVEYAHITP